MWQVLVKTTKLSVSIKDTLHRGIKFQNILATLKLTIRGSPHHLSHFVSEMS
jgi:hypothetical protein